MRRKTARKLEIKLLICFLMISIITVGFSSFKAAFSFIGDITIIGAPRTVTVTYDANGGTILNNSSATITVDYAIGDQYGAFPDVERSGYTLLGWYYNGEQITQYTTIDSDNHTVTAEWEEEIDPTIEYSVTLNAGENGYFIDSFGNEVNEISYFLGYSNDSDLPISLSETPTPYDDIYVFRGWNSDSGIYISATEPCYYTNGELNGQTLYAIWENMSGYEPGPGEGEISITFNLNDTPFVMSDDTGMETQWYEYRTDYSSTSLPIPYDPTSSYNFTGWYSEMNGGQVTDEYGMPLYGDISSLNGTTLTPIYE